MTSLTLGSRSGSPGWRGTNDDVTNLGQSLGVAGVSRDELHQSLEAVVDGRLGQRRVDEATRRALAELTTFVAERDLDDAGDVTWRRLDLDGVRRDELQEEKHRTRVTSVLGLICQPCSELSACVRSRIPLLHHKQTLYNDNDVIPRSRRACCRRRPEHRRRSDRR